MANRKTRLTAADIGDRSLQHVAGIPVLVSVFACDGAV
jgi:hypothetical protein